MGLSDKGLVLVIVFSWAPLLLIHWLIVKRSMRIASIAVSEYNRNLISLVAFMLILFLYTLVCTLTMYASMNDLENSQTPVTLAAEVIWLFSPVIATVSILKIHPSIYPSCFQIIPTNKSSLKLATKRAFVIGIPLCLLFSIGDQILRQGVGYVVNGNPSDPVPVNRQFLSSVGSTFGYNGGKGIVCFVIGFFSCLSLGPFVDVIAPASDSVYIFANSVTGVALYLLYSIFEEIGWTGALYPMLIKHFSSSTMGGRNICILKSMTVTGLTWGLWHCPFVILKWAPGIDALSSFLYNILFVLSCIAARYILLFLVWQPSEVPASNNNLLDSPVVSPSLLPAIFGHAAMNTWWSFYYCLYDWNSVPTWSLLLGSEFSLLAVTWQFAVALVIIRSTFKKRVVGI
jgi:hypothetical protein